MDEKEKRKNILDLQFQKYLIMASTSVIVSFTYLIGVMLALFSEQINLSILSNIIALSIISSAVLGTCAIIFFNSTFHLRNIPEVIKEI